MRLPLDLGFPGDSVVKNSAAMQEMQVRSLDQADPLEKEMVTHSSILAWEIHGQRRLVGYSPCGHKELDMTSQLNNKNYSTMIYALI